MPVATIDPAKFDRVQLKSLEGAYIEVRPLPYGKKLERRDKATRMFMEQEAASGKSRKQVETEINRFELETLNKWARVFDFKYCIGDHNLTDPNGAKLDLGSPMTLETLDPRVGSEIENLLDKINNEDEDEDEEVFTQSPSSSSEVAQIGSAEE
jgi:hypothetical protein